MRKKSFILFLLNPLLTIIVSTSLLGRNIYLNGNDISNAKAQKLEDVDLLIDKDGNIFISASHYKIEVEENYYPLNKSQLYPNHKKRKKPTPQPSPKVTPSTERKKSGIVHEKWQTLEGAQTKPVSPSLEKKETLEVSPVEPTEPASPQVPVEPAPQVL